jgi:hypothetical protein
LLVKTGSDTVDVYLCPKSFLDDMGVSLGKGDEIALTGSKVKQGEADLILAREVVKGTRCRVRCGRHSSCFQTSPIGRD